jgi:hypothetical protein
LPAQPGMGKKCSAVKADLGVFARHNKTPINSLRRRVVVNG